MLKIRVKRYLWELENIFHIARHGITTDDVEEALNERTLNKKTYKGRILAIGITNQEKIIATVLEYVTYKDAYYIVTARPASKKERKEYELFETNYDKKETQTHSKL
jgi:uncharacterized DUF497 family protein